MKMCTSVVALLALLGAPCTNAQPYPVHTIKILHGFQTGGPPDIVLRQIAARLGPRLGVPVVVENRPGASGTVAASAAARAEPDGSVLLFGVAANLAVAPAMMKQPPYDPLSAFAPIVEVARGPYVWLVRGDLPVRSLGEMIEWARSHPGKLNYASPGEGTVHHLATEMFARAAGISLVHVPYTTGTYAALLGGQVDAMFDSMPGPLAHISSGKLRALALTGERRISALPEVATLGEHGIAGVDVNSWWGFVGPAGLPSALVARLNEDIRRSLAEAEVKAAFAKMAIDPSPGTPAAFGATIAKDYERWKQAVATAGLKLQ